MKPILMTEQTKQQLIDEFTKYVNNDRFRGEEINFSRKIILAEDTHQKAKLFIDAAAYLKMMIYIRDSEKELAWHGTVTKRENVYYIHDVFLYPQKVGSATVNTDQDKYNEWTENLDDETFNSMRFQGHSHVNFGTTPSGTDITYYNEILNVLSKNDFYIFMIMNKKGEYTVMIYDLADNIIYEKQDIDMHVMLGTNTDLIKTLTEEKETNCKSEYSYPTTYYGKHGSYSDKFLKYQYDDYDYGTISKTEPDLDDIKVSDKLKPDVNDLIDDIDQKFKNITLKSIKRKK